jgi:hypothetical protein
MGLKALATVRATKLPRIEYIFNLIQGEPVVAHNFWDIDVSVQSEMRALMFESEKQL